MTGFLATLMRFAERLMLPLSCFAATSRAAMVAAEGWEGSVEASGMGRFKTAAVTSFGKSTNTGPGRPEVAISNASLILLGSSATFLTITFHFVHAREIPTMSASWKASEPMADVTT